MIHFCTDAGGLTLHAGCRPNSTWQPKVSFFRILRRNCMNRWRTSFTKIQHIETVYFFPSPSKWKKKRSILIAFHRPHKSLVTQRVGHTFSFFASWLYTFVEKRRRRSGFSVFLSKVLNYTLWTLCWMYIMYKKSSVSVTWSVSGVVSPPQ